MGLGVGLDPNPNQRAAVGHVAPRRLVRGELLLPGLAWVRVGVGVGVRVKVRVRVRVRVGVRVRVPPQGLAVAAEAQLALPP